MARKWHANGTVNNSEIIKIFFVINLKFQTKIVPFPNFNPETRTNGKFARH